MKITAISDPHGNLKNIHRIGDSLKDADLVIISGDLSRAGDYNSAVLVLEAVEGYNRNILAVHGNWDTHEIRDLLEEKDYSLHGRGRLIDETGFFGCGGSNKTPLNTASEYSEEEILEILEAGWASVKSAEVKILVSHAPPHKILDRTFLGIRAGSVSVNRFISEKKIDLCFCGHIHEASGKADYENTVVINSGSLKSGRYSEANTDKKTGSVLKLNRFLFF